jgi:hypothetical protein
MKKEVLIIPAVILFSLVPVLICAHLPLVDYPNHLGRLQVYHNISTDQYLAQFYTFRWIFTPNLAIDALVLPLAHFLSIELSARIIVIISLAIIYLATILLDRQLNKETWGLSLFSGILLYNGAFQFGFINFIIGVGFALVAFGLWVRYREHANGLTLGMLVCVGIVVFLMHLYAFGLYAVCVAGYEISAFWEAVRKNRSLRGTHFGILIRGAFVTAIPLLLMLLSPASQDATKLRWSTLLGKMEGITSPTFFALPYIELPLLVAIVAIFGIGLVLGIIHLNKRMVLACGIFVVLFLVMPRELLGANYADYRLPGGAGFFVLASFRWGTRSLSSRRVLTLLLAMCLVIRVVSIFLTWLPAQPIIAEYDQALAHIPPGSRLLVLLGSSGSASVDRRPPLEHVPVYYGVKHDVFVSYIFNLPRGAELLQFTPEYQEYSRFYVPYPEFARDMAKFDYVLEIRNPHFDVPTGLSLEEVTRGKTYLLQRVVRP